MSALSASAPAPSRSVPWPWLLVAAVLVVFRTLPYAWWGTLAFDADQAVVGLMSKHIAEFRALPVYQYGLPYVLMVSAYVTAPFMWIFGPTVFALKLPLVFMNVGVGLGLVVAIVRAGVHPATAVILSLPLLMTSGVGNATLMDTLGMTVEPLGFVLVLWHARRAPVVFGVVAALGFHVREFVAYGVAAMLAVHVLTGQAVSRDGRRRWLQTALAALGTTALISGVARFGSVGGPETWLSSDLEGNLSTLGGAFCFMPQQAWRNVVDLGVSYLGVLWGAVPVPLSQAAVQTRVSQGVPGAWPAFAVVLLLLVGRIATHWRTIWARRHDTIVQLAAFLVMVGAQGVGVYAISRCGPLSILTVRYALLGLFLPTGLALLAWATGPARAWRQGLAAALITLAAVNAWPHARLWREQLAAPTTSNRVLLAAALEARGIRYARSDYWTAYYVDFLTQERVVVGSETLSRIDVYERALAQHPGEVVTITTDRCGTTPAIVPGYYVCGPSVP